MMLKTPRSITDSTSSVGSAFYNAEGLDAAGLRRAQPVLGSGSLVTSLGGAGVRSRSPTESSPRVVGERSSPRLFSENSDGQGNVAESGNVLQVLTKLDRYKQQTETLILERYYALERTLERMLQEALPQLSVQSVQSSMESAPPPPPDALLHLGKRIEQAEARAADERWGMQRFIADGFKNMESTLEREMNRQCDLLQSLKHEGHQREHRGHEEKADLRDVKFLRRHSLGSATDANLDDLTRSTVKFQDDAEVQENDDIEEGAPKSRKNSALSNMAAATSRGVSMTNQLAYRAIGFVRQHNHITHHSSKTRRELFTTRNVAAKNSLHALVQKVSTSHVFVGVMEFCIITNVLIKAVQMDIDVKRAVRREQQVVWGYYVDVFFTCIFVLELAVRLGAEHCSFFIGRNRGWNLFDFAVVACSVFEISTDGLSIGFLRIFRSLRLVRVLKIVRVFRFFRELRLMAVSIASCMVSLFWALVLMFIVVLVFAMFVLEGSKNYIRNTAVTDKSRIEMVALYGSFGEAIYSLVQAISGGGDWGNFAAPLLEVSPLYGVGFALFVSFVTLGMMNILIGIFVENAQQYSQLDRDLVIQEEMQTRKSYMNQLKDLFHEMDEDKSGTITYQEFTECLSHERAKAYLDFLQLNAAEAQGLFMLLDLDENGEVGVEEFVLGCMRLKGAAKSIDAASMMYQTKRLAVKVNELYEYSKHRLDLIVKTLKIREDQSASKTFSQV